jgi:hypothetical protein
MVKDLDDACFSDTAGLKVFHSILPCKVYSFNFCNRVGDLVCALRLLGLALKEINLVSNQDLDWNFTCSLTLCNPLFDSFESRSLTDVKQVNDGSATVDVFVYILMVPLLARHVKVYNFVLVDIINIESGLKHA